MRAGTHALAQGSLFSLQIDWRLISITLFARKSLSRPNFKVWTGNPPSGRETTFLDGKPSPSQEQVLPQGKSLMSTTRSSMRLSFKSTISALVLEQQANQKFQLASTTGFLACLFCAHSNHPERNHTARGRRLQRDQSQIQLMEVIEAPRRP